MIINSLSNYVKLLESCNELIRIYEYIDPNLEISEIVDRVVKNNGPALLFQNNGTNFPLLINCMGSYRRICIALRVNNLNEIEHKINNILNNFIGNKQYSSIFDKLKLLPKLLNLSYLLPKNLSYKGECQEIVLKNPDINIFPILKCWPMDGGNFLTLPMIHTLNPYNKILNVGMYRMQIFGPKLTAIHWHKHKVSKEHFNYYKKLKKKMPIAVTLGGDPIYTYCATAPLPSNIEEYLLAGILRNKGVELVNCLTQPIRVPRDVDIVIEGYIDPSEDYILEGPFGDHTGYYSLEDYYPKFHITCITHRKNAIYPATIVGIPPQEDTWIGKATERIFLLPIKMSIIPEIIDIRFPVEGVFHNLVIIKIKKNYPGQAFKVINAVWGTGQLMLTKIVIVIDENIDLYEDLTIAKIIFNNINNQNIIFTNGPIDVLDHACDKLAFGGKIGIDATDQLYEEKISNIKKCSLTKKLFQEIDINNIKKIYPEIQDMKLELLLSNVPVIFIAIKKSYYKHIFYINNSLFKLKCFNNIKTIIYLDFFFKEDNISSLLWRCLNNIDPKRDSYIINNKECIKIGFDCTIKTLKIDKFERKWPNIITSNNKTINKINTIWPKLRLGEIIESPSKKYKQ